MIILYKDMKKICKKSKKDGDDKELNKWNRYINRLD